jgi:hypothetical protein
MGKRATRRKDGAAASLFRCSTNGRASLQAFLDISTSYSTN